MGRAISMENDIEALYRRVRDIEDKVERLITAMDLIVSATTKGTKSNSKKGDVKNEGTEDKKKTNSKGIK